METINYNFFGDELKRPIDVVKLEKITQYNFSEAHRHNYNEVFFFINEGGSHMIDFTSEMIKNNSIHVVSSNKVHKVLRNENSYGYVLLFKDDFLKKYNKEIDIFF